MSLPKGVRWPTLVVIVLALLVGAVLWEKPWADSVLRVTVAVTTDGAGPQVVRAMQRFFSRDTPALPTCPVEVDLSEWAGQLALVEVSGAVSVRGLASDTAGYTACEADLVTPKGTTPIEFLGWQQGPDLGVHWDTLGPRSCCLPGQGEERFVFATKGTLWHALRVPDRARLRLRLRPVPAARIGNTLEPYIPRDGSLVDRRAQFPVRRPERPADVFIYLIDALRADHLGCYGYHRDTSPVMDTFAAEATLYERAHTPATWTRPSVATLFSGLNPTVHGAVHWSDGLAEWPVLMPEILKDAGYTGRAFVTNGNVTADMGFDQGWDELVFRQRTAQWVNRMAERALRQQDPDEPMFMYCHTVEPHMPYTPGPDALRRFDRGIPGRCDGTPEALGALGVLDPDLSTEDVEHLLDLYDGEVWEADQGFGDFLHILKRAGRYEDSLIILLSDHGEAFDEHDTLGHGWDLNQETMHVVLVIKYPNGRHGGLRVKQRVAMADILPTVLAEVGLRPELPYRLAGQDLAYVTMAAAPEPSRRVYGEVSRWDGNDVNLVAVIDEDGYKRVIDVSVPPQETAPDNTTGLWNTRADPKEKQDLLAELPVRAAYDEQLIARWLVQQKAWRERSATEPAPRITLKEAMRRHLEALGYIGR